MTEIKIEKGIPMPAFRNGLAYLASSKWGIIFRNMEPTDSFYLPGIPGNQMRYVAKKLGFKITCRKLVGGGFRVWLKSKPKAELASSKPKVNGQRTKRASNHAGRDTLGSGVLRSPDHSDR